MGRPEIVKSEMTGRWYIVTSWRKDGSAGRKVDVTDQMEAILAKFGATQKEETPEGWVEVDGRWYNSFPAQKEETNG